MKKFSRIVTNTDPETGNATYSDVYRNYLNKDSLVWYRCEPKGSLKELAPLVPMELRDVDWATDHGTLTVDVKYHPDLDPDVCGSFAKTDPDEVMLYTVERNRNTFYYETTEPAE